jgi:hypothetical protein
VSELLLSLLASEKPAGMLTTCTKLYILMDLYTFHISQYTWHK